MKLGVFLALFGNQPLDNALDYVKRVGLRVVEIGAGNYPGSPHIKVDELLKDEDKRKEFKEKFESRGIEISALSCHGNPLHPNKKYAQQNHDVQRKAIKLASLLGVNRIVTFSGCPGGSEKDTTPNWVTCPWPTDFSDIVQWQWDKKVIPYWKKENQFAKDNGVRVAIELHPGFVVYNTETMLRLREEAGKNIGANFDPSHMFWQGIDPIMAIRELGEALFYSHAKDTKINAHNTTINGVLDTKHYGDELHRSWIFRTVGYGHSFEFWNDYVSTLRMVGYDDVLSIEHEDSLMSVNEGLTKAVSFLNQVLLHEDKGSMWWA